MGDKRMFPYLTLTLAQQGGIGYPPVVIKLDKWYSVSDSRFVNMPKELEPITEPQIIYPKKTRHYHTQTWVMNKFNRAPQKTWSEILKMIHN